MRDTLHQRAAALQRAGLAAARGGELHRSLSLLRRAAGLAPLDARAAQVLALVALCLGETGVAARASRRAGADEPAFLNAGSVREALPRYNQALAEARAGNSEAAESRVREALEHFPDLVPAHRLHALLAAQRGDVPGARAACEAGLAVCRDDLLLQRCLASLATPPAFAAPAPVAVPPRRPRFIAHAMWAASMIAAVVVTRMLGGDTGRGAVQAPPASAPAPAPVAAPAPAPAQRVASAAPFDFAAYRRGRDAFAREEWQGAIGELSGAAAAPADAYYRDDALYLLARAQARAPRPADARRTAALLLAGHPASIFANRITRRIAEQGTE